MSPHYIFFIYLLKTAHKLHSHYIAKCHKNIDLLIQECTHKKDIIIITTA